MRTRPINLALALLGLLAGAAAAPPTGRPSASFPEIAPAEHERALAALREAAAAVMAGRQLQLAEIDAEPFLIFTDWPMADVGPLRAQLARAYAALSRRLGAARGQNVFHGRLLVLALQGQEAFGAVVEDLGLAPRNAADLGVFAGRSDGLALIVLARPAPRADQRDSAAARRDLQSRWSSAVARTMAAAVVFRLHAPADGRPPADLPPWLARGLAAMLQHDLVPPRPQDVQAVRAAANAGAEFDVSLLFGDELPGSDFIDAAAASLVRTLAERDRAALDALVRRCRNGQSAEAALRDTFGFDYEGLIERWRKHLQTARP